MNHEEKVDAISTELVDAVLYALENKTVSELLPAGADAISADHDELHHYMNMLTDEILRKTAQKLVDITEKED